MTLFIRLLIAHANSLASISVSSYAISVSVIQEELQTSRQLALAGISAYTIMFGITPLVLAPLSEIYGRRKIYIFSAAFFAAFHIPQATAANMETMLVARCLSGAGGSTAIALVVSPQRSSLSFRFVGPASETWRTF